MGSPRYTVVGSLTRPYAMPIRPNAIDINRSRLGKCLHIARYSRSAKKKKCFTAFDGTPTLTLSMSSMFLVPPVCSSLMFKVWMISDLNIMYAHVFNAWRNHCCEVDDQGVVDSKLYTFIKECVNRVELEPTLNAHQDFDVSRLTTSDPWTAIRTAVTAGQTSSGENSHKIRGARSARR
jgi:hypothetical protein